MISQLYPHDIPNSWLDTHIKVDSLLFMDQSPQFLVVTTTLLMVKSAVFDRQILGKIRNFHG